MNKKASSFFRVDEQVFFTMGGLCLFAIIIMAFQFGTREACAPVKIQVTSPELIENRLIRFKAETMAGRTFLWNFGDGTEKEEQLAITSHEYKKPGNYTVTVMVNGNCADIINIKVDDFIDTISNLSLPMIIASVQDTAYLNEPVFFSNTSTNATEWEWKFGESGEVDSRDSTPFHTFMTTGINVIRLKINNRDDLVKLKELYVVDRAKIGHKPKPEETPHKGWNGSRLRFSDTSDAPPLPNPDGPAKVEVIAKPKAPTVTELQLEALLKEVAQGTKTAEDFSAYLGGEVNIRVSYNKEVISFSSACAKLKDIGIRKIKSITVSSKEVDPETNRVISMKIKVDRRFLGL